MKCLNLLAFFVVLSVDDGCPNGWLTHNSRCYHFSRETETWPDAMTLCKIMKGQLVEINDAEENRYLETQAKQRAQTYWIALSDLEEESSWVWMNSGQHVTGESFTDWAPGQPSNGGSNENCGHIYKGIAYHWNDAPCKNNYHYILVCETEDSVHIIG